jgi:hypothetical protein
MKVYRVSAEQMNQYAWVAAESESDAIDTISLMRLFEGPLTAAVDNKKMDLPRGVVLTADGKTFDIVKGRSKADRC